jgi:hypothetical protein
MHAAGLEMFGKVCTADQLTAAETVTIHAYVAHGFRPGDAKATPDVYDAADQAVEPNGTPPACRGVLFALEQVGLVFTGEAPPSDLVPGARAAYEKVAGG